MDNRKVRTTVVYDLQVLNHLAKQYVNGLTDAIEVSCFEKGRGPSSTNIFILAYLYGHQDREVYQKDLEEALQVRGATISRVLKGMEKKNLVTREQAEHDNRLKSIKLTQESLDNIQCWMKNFEMLTEKMTAGFTREELSQLEFLVKKAKKNLEEERNV